MEFTKEDFIQKKIYLEQLKEDTGLNHTEQGFLNAMNAYENLILFDVVGHSEQLNDKKILNFDEWKKQNRQLISDSMGITGNEIAMSLRLYDKYIQTFN